MACPCRGAGEAMEGAGVHVLLGRCRSHESFKSVPSALLPPFTNRRSPSSSTAAWFVRGDGQEPAAEHAAPPACAWLHSLASTSYTHTSFSTDSEFLPPNTTMRPS